MSKTVLTTSEIQFANAEFLPEVVKILNEAIRLHYAFEAILCVLSLRTIVTKRYW